MEAALQHLCLPSSTAKQPQLAAAPNPQDPNAMTHAPADPNMDPTGRAEAGRAGKLLARTHSSRKRKDQPSPQEGPGLVQTACSPRRTRQRSSMHAETGRAPGCLRISPADAQLADGDRLQDSPRPAKTTRRGSSSCKQIGVRDDQPHDGHTLQGAGANGNSCAPLSSPKSSTDRQQGYPSSCQPAGYAMLYAQGESAPRRTRRQSGQPASAAPQQQNALAEAMQADCSPEADKHHLGSLAAAVQRNSSMLQQQAASKQLSTAGKACHVPGHSSDQAAALGRKSMSKRKACLPQSETVNDDNGSLGPASGHAAAKSGEQSNGQRKPVPPQQGTAHEQGGHLALLTDLAAVPASARSAHGRPVTTMPIDGGKCPVINVAAAATGRRSSRKREAAQSLVAKALPRDDAGQRPASNEVVATLGMQSRGKRKATPDQAAVVSAEDGGLRLPSSVVPAAAAQGRESKGKQKAIPARSASPADDGALGNLDAALAGMSGRQSNRKRKAALLLPEIAPEDTADPSKRHRRASRPAPMTIPEPRVGNAAAAMADVPKQPKKQQDRAMTERNCRGGQSDPPQAMEDAKGQATGGQAPRRSSRMQQMGCLAVSSGKPHGWCLNDAGYDAGCVMATTIGKCLYLDLLVKGPQMMGVSALKMLLKIAKHRRAAYSQHQLASIDIASPSSL